MTAFNVVRFRVKPGQEKKFLDVHRKEKPNFKGFEKGHLVKTGEQTYCLIGQWKDLESLAQAEAGMVKILDKFRDTLEDLGGGLGVTDPVGGESIMVLKPE